MNAQAVSHSEFAAALLDPQDACPAGLRSWNGSDPARRLAVHRNTVVGSLVDALADTFPVVQELVGTDFFRALAAVYVRQEPPASPLLVHYGAGLPVFIEGFAPARELPYLADIARLEFARVQAYHAADTAAIGLQEAQSRFAKVDDAGACGLVTHPALRLVASRHAVVSIWAAHQGHGELADVDVDSPETALVVRPAFDVAVLSAPPGTAEFLAAADEGCNLARCAAAAVAAHPGFDLPGLLALLLGHGALATVHPPGEPLA